jgi:hypothetical protein
MATMKEKKEALKKIKAVYENDGQTDALRLAYKSFGHLGETHFCCGCETDTLYILDTCCVCGAGIAKVKEEPKPMYVRLMADDGHTHFAVVSHPKKNGLQMEKDWNTCVTQANKARCDWSFDDDLVPRMKDKGWSFEGIPTVTLHY